jgi:hypothetical protein
MTDNVDEVALVSCSVCEYETESDNLVTTDYDSLVCDDCAQICNRCDVIGSTNDIFHTVDDDFTWCEACTDRRAYWCEGCESYNSDGTSEIVDRGEYWCNNCTSEGAYWCDDCEQYNQDGCDSCGSDNDGHGRVIHDYSYRPDAIFHSTDNNERLFFGLEIEVEASHRLREASIYAQQLEALDLAYLKHDGSLNNGFEIVTHPMSHGFFKNEAQELWDTLEQLRTNSNYRVKSWDTKTCGLHIHISRTGFNGGAHMHRFLNLVYSNPDFYSTLAGRTSDQWAKFTDIYQRDYVRDANGERIYHDDGRGYEIISKRTFMHKLNTDRNSDRYSAVNTNNRETLEMRIFRGSVNGDTIKAQIDLAHASVEYTRTLTVQDVRNGALSADLFMWYIFQHEDLYPELSARIDKLVVGLARQNESV